MDWSILLFVLLGLSVPLMHFAVMKFASSQNGDMEPEIEWVESTDLPKKASRQFELKGPEFSRSGLRPLGILKVRHRMMTMYDCYFRGQDHTIVAEVSYVYMFGFFVTSSVAAKSLLDDGTIVETSSHKELPSEIAGMADERYFELNCAGTDEVAELLESHQRALRNVIGGATDRSAIQMTQEMVAEATMYGLNLADRYLHKSGVIAEPPKPLFSDEHAEVTSA